MASHNATQSAKSGNTLPVVVAKPSRAPAGAPASDTSTGRYYRYRLPSGFASQLVAARRQMTTQRALRRAPTNLAIEAYRSSNERKVRRMPVGYSLSESA